MAGDVVSYQGYDEKVISTTVALGEATSAAIDLGDWTYAAIVMPSTWTVPTGTALATMTFQVSRDGTNWGNLYTDYNTEVTTYASANYHTSFGTALTFLRPWRYIKVRNGTASAPATQAAARTIYMVVK
jgi:hypothetical protein